MATLAALENLGVARSAFGTGSTICWTGFWILDWTGLWILDWTLDWTLSFGWSEVVMATPKNQEPGASL